MPGEAELLAALLGFGNVAGLNSLDSWLGRSAKYIVQFGDISSPSAFESSVWGELVQSGSMQTFTNSTTFVESVPLAFGNFVDASTASGQATARSPWSTATSRRAASGPATRGAQVDPSHSAARGAR